MALNDLFYYLPLEIDLQKTLERVSCRPRLAIQLSKEQKETLQLIAGALKFTPLSPYRRYFYFEDMSITLIFFFIDPLSRGNTKFTLKILIVKYFFCFFI